MSNIISGLGLLIKIVLPFFGKCVWFNPLFLISISLGHFLFGCWYSFMSGRRNILKFPPTPTSISTFLIKTSQIILLYFSLFLFFSAQNLTIFWYMHYSIINVPFLWIFISNGLFEQKYVSRFVLKHFTFTECSWIS